MSTETLPCHAERSLRSEASRTLCLSNDLLGEAYGILPRRQACPERSRMGQNDKFLSSEVFGAKNPVGLYQPGVGRITGAEFFVADSSE